MDGQIKPCIIIIFISLVASPFYHTMSQLVTSDRRHGDWLTMTWFAYHCRIYPLAIINDSMHWYQPTMLKSSSNKKCLMMTSFVHAVQLAYSDHTLREAVKCSSWNHSFCSVEYWVQVNIWTLCVILYIAARLQDVKSTTSSQNTMRQWRTIQSIYLKKNSVKAACKEIVFCLYVRSLCPN